MKACDSSYLRFDNFIYHVYDQGMNSVSMIMWSMRNWTRPFITTYIEVLVAVSNQEESCYHYTAANNANAAYSSPVQDGDWQTPQGNP